MTDEAPKPAVFQMGEHLDADQTLKIVREARLGLMDLQMTHGLMTTKDDFAMFHANLQALSGDAQREKQFIQEEKSSEVMMQLAKQASEDLANRMGLSLFTQQQPVDITERTSGLAAIEGTATVVDGELFVGTDVRTYDEFSATVGADLDRRRRGEPENGQPAETSDSP